MTAVFWICALVGGTIMVLQFVMLFIGLGDAHDIDVVDDLPDDLPGHFDHEVAHDADHHDSTGFFRVISFRTVVAALAFFGLAGLASSSAELDPAPTLAIAVVTGLSAMYGVFWLMQSMRHLQAEGTARIEHTLGRSGTVYLRIPGRRSGAGKVTVELKDRTMEYEAVTSEDELPTGAKVVVTAVIGPDTVEVQPAPQSGGE